jgi:hypothetical protein
MKGNGAAALSTSTVSATTSILPVPRRSLIWLAGRARTVPMMRRQNS